MRFEESWDGKEKKELKGIIRFKPGVIWVERELESLWEN
jgi:hypothetical protein